MDDWMDLEKFVPQTNTVAMTSASGQGPNRIANGPGQQDDDKDYNFPLSTLHGGGSVQEPLNIGEETWGLLEALEKENTLPTSSTPSNHILDITATTLDLGEAFGLGSTACDSCRSGTKRERANCDDGLCAEDILRELMSEAGLPTELSELMDLMEADSPASDSGSTPEKEEVAPSVSSPESTETLDECPLASRQVRRKRKCSDEVLEFEGATLAKASKYHEMRRKNNEASKRSRKQRKHKEMSLEQTVESLEMNNDKLKRRVLRLEELISTVKAKLMVVMTNK